MSAPARPQERLEGKVSPRHRDRLAAVYVRQSTAQQVQDHQESTRLQYGLAERAVGLGWAPSRVLVIDEDLGHSASGADTRPGFQRLVPRSGWIMWASCWASRCRGWHAVAGNGISSWSCALCRGPCWAIRTGSMTRLIIMTVSCWGYPPPPDRRLQRRATFRRASGNGRWRLV